MILIITNREDVTSDVLILQLQEQGIQYYRFNSEDYPSKVSIHIQYSNDFSGFIFDKIKERKIEFSSIRSVYYRRPALPVPHINSLREDLEKFAIIESLQTFRGLLQNLSCFWVSEPARIRLAENKITQLNVAQKIGFKIPETIISNVSGEIGNFVKQYDSDVVIKPVKSGFVSDNEVLFTNLLQNEEPDFSRAEVLPSIYQRHIKKKYDIRVTVLGNRIFPLEIHSQEYEDSKIDWRKSDNLTMEQKEHYLPKKIQEKCFDLVKHFALAFGAIDLILTPQNEYVFLELNPNGQWAWIEQRTNYKITEALIDLLLRGEN